MSQNKNNQLWIAVLVAAIITAILYIIIQERKTKPSEEDFGNISKTPDYTDDWAEIEKDINELGKSFNHYLNATEK
jgi:signal transduction histidine kinase